MNGLRCVGRLEGLMGLVGREEETGGEGNCCGREEVEESGRRREGRHEREGGG